jgi:hypothetical protein
MNILNKEDAVKEYLHTEDRREYERFRVVQGVYAVFETYSSKRGPVIDISEKGVAFQYLAGKKKADSEGHISIFISDNGFYLKDIPITIVSDIEIKKMSFFSGTQMRRCGGQFGELTPAQAAKLDFFMKNYIVLAE